MPQDYKMMLYRFSLSLLHFSRCSEMFFLPMASYRNLSKRTVYVLFSPALLPRRWWTNTDDTTIKEKEKTFSFQGKKKRKKDWAACLWAAVHALLLSSYKWCLLICLFYLIIFLLYVCTTIFTLKRWVWISWSQISNLVVVCSNIWWGGNIISLHGRLNLSEKPGPLFLIC